MLLSLGSHLASIAASDPGTSFNPGDLENWNGNLNKHSVLLVDDDI